MVKMEWEQIKEDDYVKNWFEQLKSEKTKQNYSERFPRFLEFVNQTPTQIIVSRLNHLVTKDLKTRRYWETQLIKFTRHLEKQVDEDGRRKLTKSSIKGIQTAVMSFFSKNGVKLLFSRGELDVEPAKREKVVRKWVLTNEEVRLLYRSVKSARDRSVVLTLYQSGFSSVDVSNMRIEDFGFYDKDGNWILEPFKDLYVARLREKTDILQETCLSRECIEDVRLMLQNRGFPKEGWLFISSKGEQFSQRFINETLKSAVNKHFPQDKAVKWKTKFLRDSYKNGLLQAKLTQEVVDCMFGHQRKQARKNYQLTEETTRMMYNEAFRFLTINGVGSTTRRLEQVEKDFNEKVGQLTIENENLKQRQETLEKQLKDVKEWAWNLASKDYRKSHPKETQ